MQFKLIRLECPDTMLIRADVLGPLIPGSDPNTAPLQILKFTNTVVPIVDDAGTVADKTCWVASVQLLTDARYMLSWVVEGAVGEDIEFKLDRESSPTGAKFVSISKDKVPPTGTAISRSRALPSGRAAWSNNNFFKG
ncbi:MAG: hypothetical protein ACKOPM_00675 [Novosphingobium sp.]